MNICRLLGRPGAILALFVGYAVTGLAAQVPVRAPDRTLGGTIRRTDHQTSLSIPFDVPKGVDRLVIAFEHDGRATRTVVDLGLRDPAGFRGASGSEKAVITLSPRDATPSYLAGPIKPGHWSLVLGVPNIRAGIQTHWIARLWFVGPGDPALPVAVRDRGQQWYRGDLHLHTAHSDGRCAGQTSEKVPCPVFRTLESAIARGLDFIAITDHNTVSQLDAVRELQPSYPQLLVVPGQEVTTFFGHFNVFGIEAPIDYRIGPDAAAFAAAVKQVHALGGIVSINHPALPSGEICMGCGWTMLDPPGIPPAAIDAVEIVNGGAWRAGGSPDGALSGIGFWTTALQRARVTAIGGSDNHDARDLADLPGTIGRPTTVVAASALTIPAILDGIRRGRVFVDLTSGPDTELDMAIDAAGATTLMGGAITVAPGEKLRVRANAKMVGDYRLMLLIDDRVAAERNATSEGLLQADLIAAPGGSIVRAIVRRTDGTIALIGNAITIATSSP